MFMMAIGWELTLGITHRIHYYTIVMVYLITSSPSSLSNAASPLILFYLVIIDTGSLYCQAVKIIFMITANDCF